MTFFAGTDGLVYCRVMIGTQERIIPFDVQHGFALVGELARAVEQANYFAHQQPPPPPPKEVTRERLR